MVGIIPKEFLQQLTLFKAKAWLESRHSVLAAGLESGLSGKSRLHDLFLRFEAMTPGEYKSEACGLTLQWGQAPSPLGIITLGTTFRGICHVSFGHNPKEA